MVPTEKEIVYLLFKDKSEAYPALEGCSLGKCERASFAYFMLMYVYIHMNKASVRCTGKVQDRNKHVKLPPQIIYSLYIHIHV